MYNVILVDDEYWALKANLKIFNWEDFEFNVIGETTDSEQALEMIVEKKPDVVFLDINMPGISGLELIDILAGKTDPKFIIISAYREFEYAQKAIQLNVFEYCLKPVRVGEANRILEKLKTTLDKERNIINIDENMERYNFGKPDIDNIKFKKMLVYIFENINDKLNLSTLANMFSLNPNYSSSLFNKYFYCGFSDYVAGIRMTNAAKMLKSSNLSIEDIALKNGYEDYYYFNKVFKKVIGVTPSEFRKQHKNGGGEQE